MYTRLCYEEPAYTSFSFILRAWTVICHLSELPSRKTPIQTYVIMLTISPFGLDGNPTSLKVILPLWHQGQRVMLPLSACWIFCSAVLSKLPLTVGKICKKMFCKRNMTLYTINDLPTTKDSYIHPSPNQVGIDSSTQLSGDTLRILHMIKTRTLLHSFQA